MSGPGPQGAPPERAAATFAAAGRGCAAATDPSDMRSKA
jgi:hypothetical protein